MSLRALILTHLFSSFLFPRSNFNGLFSVHWPSFLLFFFSSFLLYILLHSAGSLENCLGQKRAFWISCNLNSNTFQTVLRWRWSFFSTDYYSQNRQLTFATNPFEYYFLYGLLFIFIFPSFFSFADACGLNKIWCDKYSIENQ